MSRNFSPQENWAGVMVRNVILDIGVGNGPAVPLGRPIDSRAARTIPGPAQSIAMIVATAKLVEAKCNRSPGWPGASFDSSTRF